MYAIILKEAKNSDEDKTLHNAKSRGGVAKIKGTGKTRRKGAHDGLTSFSVHRNLVPPFTILSMTCQFMVPQQ